MFYSTVLIIPPRDHARHWHLLDQLAQLRYRIFVEQLGWTLPLAAHGRETDQYDDHRASYVIVRGVRGDIRAAIRLHDTAGQTLLNTSFPNLINGPVPRSTDVWEGTRMLINPDLGPDGATALQELLCASVRYGLANGVSRFVSVSDPLLERVLRRSGASPHRLGSVLEVEPGIHALALEMQCSTAVLARLEQRLELHQPALSQVA